MLTPESENPRQLIVASGRYDPIWGKTAGFKCDRRAAPLPSFPHPGDLTGMTEPCGALPRKCLFSY
jgi:hypothetical protein